MHFPRALNERLMDFASSNMCPSLPTGDQGEDMKSVYKSKGPVTCNNQKTCYINMPPAIKTCSFPFWQ